MRVTLPYTDFESSSAELIEVRVFALVCTLKPVCRSSVSAKETKRGKQSKLRSYSKFYPQNNW